VCFEECTKKIGYHQTGYLALVKADYDTRLMEAGKDLRFIQDLVRKSSQTIEIYTHAGRRSLQRIRSAFADL